MARMKSFGAGFTAAGWKDVPPSTSGVTWLALRAGKLGQPHGEGDDLWHWGVLPGWQQSQWQATMPHSDEPAFGKAAPAPAAKGISREQKITAHLRR